MMRIVFWQLIVSPHMAILARALAERGCDVTYVAQRAMSDARRSMGWELPDIAPAALRLAPHEQAMLQLLNQLPADSIHVCQGLRANGPIATVQRELGRRGLRHWAILETVNDAGPWGPLKRLAYRGLCLRFQFSGEGILAIGDRTPEWLIARGMNADWIVPFCYFLGETETANAPVSESRRRARIAFAGGLTPGKRVQDLILAVARLPIAGNPPELWIIGDGPEFSRLRMLGDDLLPGRVRWHGKVMQSAVPDLLSQVDCLVLPSQHDGWGAVVSEALMMGTPAICSDRCGAATAVRRSGVGGIFPMGDVDALSRLIAAAVATGPVSPERRKQLITWGRCLGSDAGAEYLENVLSASAAARPFPPAPWNAARRMLGEATP